ncbi:MAG: DUF4116 domain-containing protein [Chlamydiota bacterium]
MDYSNDYYIRSDLQSLIPSSNNSLRDLSTEECKVDFLKNGKITDDKETYIKYISSKKLKINKSERRSAFWEALAKTIFSLGLALIFSERTRNCWKSAWFGKKKFVIYVQENFGRNLQIRPILLDFIKQATLSNFAFIYLNNLPASLRDRKDIVLAAVNNSNSVMDLMNSFHNLPEKLKCDEHIALALLKRSGQSLKLLSPEIRKNRKIVLEAINQNPEAFNHISCEKLKNDPEVIQTRDESEARHKKHLAEMARLIGKKV